MFEDMTNSSVLSEIKLPLVSTDIEITTTVSSPIIFDCDPEWS